MKGIKKLLIAILFSISLALLIPNTGLMMSEISGRVEAASVKKPSCAKTQTVYVSTSSSSKTKYLQDVSANIFIKNLASNAKITSIKSSNKKIIAYNGLSSDYIPLRGKYIGISPKSTGLKPGAKSTISFKVTQNGKTYSLSCKITVKLRPSVFKTLSINGKNYASKFKGVASTTLSVAQKTGKFSVKMTSGKKLTQILLVQKRANGSPVVKTIKNGSKVSLKKGDYIIVYYKITKKPANYNYTGTANGLGNGEITLGLTEEIGFTIK